MLANIASHSFSLFSHFYSYWLLENDFIKTLFIYLHLLIVLNTISFLSVEFVNNMSYIWNISRSYLLDFKLIRVENKSTSICVFHIRCKFCSNYIIVIRLNVSFLLSSFLLLKSLLKYVLIASIELNLLRANLYTHLY